MANFIRALCERGAETDTGPIRFVASTENIARDGMIVEAAGWQLDNYRKNPVVLWAHDYGGSVLPIGRADIEVGDKSLIANITFDPQDEFARQVESKYRRGFLNAVSVGWETLQFEPGTSNEVRGKVTRAELLDISAVPVPGDPDALMERQARALSDLGKSLINLSEPAPEDTATVTAPSGSAVWRGIAAAMAGLFLDYGEMKDEERRPLYNFLERAYRKLGLHAPEFLGRQELEALGMAEIRGLFLADEPALLPGLFERKGAVLNSRNKNDLTQAMTLIQGVLDSAIKEETAPLTETSQQSMTENLINLRLILAQME